MARAKRGRRGKATPAPAEAPPASKPAVYGYIRCSSQHQKRSGLGLAAQERAIHDYRRALLRHVRWGGVYADQAVSASRKRLRDRAAGAELLGKLRKGDHVVIVKLDRAFRDTAEASRQVARWVEAGVAVHLLDIRVDTSTSAGRLIVDVIAAIAAWESRRMGERIAEAKREMRAMGLADNGRAQLGTRLVRRAKGAPKLAPDPIEKKWMRRVVALRKQGLLWRAIAAQLAKEGAKTRDGRRWSKQRCWRAYDREQALRAKRWPRQ